jgi:hypothetical protein
MIDHQEAQGEAVERLQKYAAEEITREDYATMNCAIFTDLIYACNYIGEVNAVKEHQVYPALRRIGQERCYHAYRVNGNRDVFSETAKYLSIGRRSLDPMKQEAVRVSAPIFNDVHTKKFSSSRQAVKISADSSTEWKIQTSHLNLYHALTGLQYVVINEPDHAEIMDEPIFDDPLRVLRKANMRLNGRKEQLKAWMGI